MHYRRSTRDTRTVQHTAAWYSTLQSSTTIRPSFVIMLKTTINKHQNHGIPAVWCTFSNCHTIQRLTITCNWLPGLLGHQQTCIICLIINTSLLFPFKGPLLICHHSHCSSALCHIPYTLKILHFKFIFSISNSFHSFSHLIKFHYFTATLLTYRNPCILPYKNKKSLQFSSPIGLRLILHLHFGILYYLTSAHVSKVIYIFQPYGWLYGHLAPSYIMVQWLWFTHILDMVSSSTSCPRFLALLSYTSCVASIQLHCSFSRPGYGNPFALATAPQCEVLHCTVSTQHSVWSLLFCY